MHYDMEETKAFQLELDVKIDGFPKNISGTVLHQDTNMWIVNNLWFGIKQCLCFIAVPDIFKDITIRPHIQPIQYDWTKLAEFVARERIWVRVER